MNIFLRRDIQRALSFNLLPGCAICIFSPRVPELVNGLRVVIEDERILRRTMEGPPFRLASLGLLPNLRWSGGF